jgi:hypothetical protein
MLHGGHPPLVMLLILVPAGASSYAATIWLGGHMRLWPVHANMVPRRFQRLGAQA